MARRYFCNESLRATAVPEVSRASVGGLRPTMFALCNPASGGMAEELYAGVAIWPKCDPAHLVCYNGARFCAAEHGVPIA